MQKTYSDENVDMAIGSLKGQVVMLQKAMNDAADQLETWANESKSGGWSTHQVTPMREKADELRRLARGVNRL